MTIATQPPAPAPAAPAAAPDPAVIATYPHCDTCGSGISSRNCATPPTRCYWCANGLHPNNLPPITWRTPDGGAW